MSLRRQVSYATTTDGFHVAYAVVGEGEPCHVFMGEFVSSVDEVQWQHPAHVRFGRFVGSLSSLVSLDPRGIGTSDAVPPQRVLQLDDWTTDILAVLDDLAVGRAVITGEGYSGHAAVAFAVRYPERTLRLALSNSHARLLTAEDYPVGTYQPEQLEGIAEMVEREWGTGRITSQFVPSLATDPSFVEYFAGRERRTAPPRTAAAVVRRMASSDVRELLPHIEAPTLVYYTGDLAHASVEHSRYLAEHIPDAILVEATGRSFYLPDETDRLNAWAEFIVGGPAALSVETKVLTILFTDVVGSTERVREVGDDRWTQILEDLDAYVAGQVLKHDGRVIKQTGDGHLVAFEAPRDAVRAALAISRGVHVLGVELRCGLHVGEVEVRPGGDLGGIAVHTAARVADAAGPRRVLVSRTMADLVAGAGFALEDRGTHELKGLAGSWQLFEVVSPD